jgi:hypothetical protein
MSQMPAISPIDPVTPAATQNIQTFSANQQFKQQAAQEAARIRLEKAKLDFAQEELAAQADLARELEGMQQEGETQRAAMQQEGYTALRESQERIAQAQLAQRQKEAEAEQTQAKYESQLNARRLKLQESIIRGRIATALGAADEEEATLLGLEEELRKSVDKMAALEITRNAAALKGEAARGNIREMIDQISIGRTALGTNINAAANEAVIQTFEDISISLPGFWERVKNTATQHPYLLGGGASGPVIATKIEDTVSWLKRVFQVGGPDAPSALNTAAIMGNMLAERLSGTVALEGADPDTVRSALSNVITAGLAFIDDNSTKAEFEEAVRNSVELIGDVPTSAILRALETVPSPPVKGPESNLSRAEQQARADAARRLRQVGRLAHNVTGLTGFDYKMDNALEYALAAHAKASLSEEEFMRSASGYGLTADQARKVFAEVQAGRSEGILSTISDDVKSEAVKQRGLETQLKAGERRAGISLKRREAEDLERALREAGELPELEF